MKPAGFWARTAAWTLDAVPALTLAVLLNLPSLRALPAALARATQTLADTLAQALLRALEPGATGLLALMGLWRDPMLLAHSRALAHVLLAGSMPTLLWFAALTCVWHVLGECSRWHATPGKRALGLTVTGTDGRAPGLARSLLRNLAGALSWLSLNLGHLLAALPPAHSALHDRLAGTRVLGPETPLPRWAWAWLALQALLGLLALGWAVDRLSAALEAALLRAPL